ncbi:MAG TPA: sigma-70 family RNA polymerase sigma factor [Acidobacteriaceae bacterium]|nr:sigma-70 family RNA polymerase sigma factor [Acidobacteriaceae bacterium]
MRSDDEAQFANLVERHWRFAWKIAWSILRNRQDAEDAAQEAFLKMMRAETWRNLRDERALVARIVWRTAVDHHSARRTRTHLHADPGSNGLSLVEELPGNDLGPEEMALAADWESAIHRLIDALPEELRQPLALSAELNSREIAETMDIPEGTVRTRLMRARQILREKIAAMEERQHARR